MDDKNDEGYGWEAEHGVDSDDYQDHCDEDRSLKLFVQAARPIGVDNYLCLSYHTKKKTYAFTQFNVPDFVHEEVKQGDKRYIKDAKSGNLLKIDSYRCDRIQIAQKTEGVCLFLIT